jgi:hypothetical protein
VPHELQHGLRHDLAATRPPFAKYAGTIPDRLDRNRGGGTLAELAPDPGRQAHNSSFGAAVSMNSEFEHRVAGNRSDWSRDMIDDDSGPEKPIVQSPALLVDQQ